MGMLKPDVNQRFTLKEIKNHRWFTHESLIQVLFKDFQSNRVLWRQKPENNNLTKSFKRTNTINAGTIINNTRKRKISRSASNLMEDDMFLTSKEKSYSSNEINFLF